MDAPVAGAPWWVSLIIAGAGALISVGAALRGREDRAQLPPAPLPPPLPPLPHPTQPSLPAIAMQSDLETVRRTAEAAESAAKDARHAADEAARRADGASAAAGAARQATDQMLPRLGRVEEDLRAQDGVLRGVEGNVIRIGERLRVKLEASDGKRERGSG